MRVSSLAVGPYRTNCHVLVFDQTVIIIDPGFESDRIIQTLAALGVRPAAVFLTHTHWDHVMALPKLVSSFENIRIFVHPKEACMLGKSGGKNQLQMVKAFDPYNVKLFEPYLYNLPEPTDVVSDGQVIDDFAILIKILHTPGHTSGSVCYYMETEHLLLSGDTLFAGTIGRTDVPGGSMSSIVSSIREKLLVLPHDTKVLCGHGPSTTIGRELQNPWLQPEVL